MTDVEIHTAECPYCGWRKNHMFTDTLTRMLNAHIRKTHPDKEAP